MKDGNTTLSVPKEFAQTLRQDFPGSNDLERLENWAENKQSNSYNKDITESELIDFDFEDLEALISAQTDEIVRELSQL